ncbi:MAG: DUF3656 domain-containing protein [Planctomycetota bacterium]
MLRLNDRIRVQPDTGDEGPAITITKMSVNKRKVTHATKGQACWIHCDKPVKSGSMVYKTGKEPPDMARRIAELPAARPAMDLKVRFSEEGMSVQAGGICTSGKGKEAAFLFEQTLELQEAKSRPLNAAVVEKEFRKTRSEKFEAGSIKVELPEGRFLPASRLKEVRRTFWEWADSHLDEETLRKGWQDCLQIFRKEMEQPISKSESPCRTVVRLSRKKKNPVKGSLAARPLSEYRASDHEVVLPEFCPEFELPALKEQIDRAIKKGARRFRVTSLFGFQVLADHQELKLTATFPIPVCNTLAVRELMSLGAEKATTWVELEEEALNDLREGSKGRVEVFTYGRIPLLSTRLDIPISGEITDSRGARFRVVEEGGLTWLYPDKVLSLPAPPDVPVYMDLTHAEPDEEAVDSFNFFRELV